MNHDFLPNSGLPAGFKSNPATPLEVSVAPPTQLFGVREPSPAEFASGVVSVKICAGQAVGIHRRPKAAAELRQIVCFHVP